MSPLAKPSMNEPEKAAVPAATTAASAAQDAAETAAQAAAAVGRGAERAAAQVADAAEALAEELHETAADLKPTTRTRLCPRCNGELIKHSDANPYKAGAYHCNHCGTCWAPGLREPRTP